MGFNELNNQQNRLTSLKNSLSGYKSKLNTQKKRKSKIEDLLKKMKSVVNDESDNVNDHITKIIRNLDNALKGTACESILLSDVKSDKEKDLNSDGNMNNAYYQLNSELTDVNRKISELEQNIKTTNSDITYCNNSIRQEKRNIANDYKSQYDQADYKYWRAKRAYEDEPTSAHLRYAYNVAKTNRNNAKYNYDMYKGWL